MRLPRFLHRIADLFSRVAPVAIVSILFISLIPVPSYTSSQLTGPYGSVSLQLVSFTVSNSTAVKYVGRAALAMYSYSASGVVFVGGSWYYVNQSVVNETATSSASQGSGASATNTSASATASASASTTASLKATAQTEVPAPIKLYGYVRFYFLKGETETIPLVFSEQICYSGNDSDFSTEYPATTYADQPLIYAMLYIVPVDPANNETVGSPLEYTYSPEYSASPYIDLYNAIVALPQFNDSMLFAYATRPSADQPALPLAPYYNLMAIVAIIVLIPLSFIDLVPSEEKKQRGLANVLSRIAFGIMVILIFPFVYDRIAYMVNVLNQMIIAYPLPYYDYSMNLIQLETYLVGPTSLSLSTIFNTAVLFIAYIIITVILWIMNFLLGTVRILLLAGMIILFPVSVALRDFRYTSKLGRMVEETLFGLILSTILSASMLGVAYFLLSNWGSPANMFRLAGIQSQWVAISAVIGALLAPTVLAPLVSTVYESTSLMASVAGGVATAEFMGIAGGAVTGFRASGGSLIGAAKGAGVGLAQSWISSMPLMGTMGRSRPYTILAHQKRIMSTLDSSLRNSLRPRQGTGTRNPDYIG